MTRWLLSLAILSTPLAVSAEDAAPSKNVRLLLVTHSAGFVHDSVAFAEKTLKEIGPKQGFDVTCYRFTNDPDRKVKTKEGETTALEEYSEKFRKSTKEPVEKSQCGRINADTLKNFDVVLFFTTGDPLNEQETKDLVEWVKNGGGVAGTHCGSDTMYPDRDKWKAAYGDLIGAYFDGHPWHQKIKLKVEDAKSPLATGFKDGDEITDEIYQFRPEPYSREKLHVVLSVDNSSIDVKKGKRKDQDYAVAWCQEVGKGRSFYTSLGHRKEVWADKRFQEHLLAGLKWAAGRIPGDATPSAKLAGK